MTRGQIQVYDPENEMIPVSTAVCFFPTHVQLLSCYEADVGRELALSELDLMCMREGILSNTLLPLSTKMSTSTLFYFLSEILSIFLLSVSCIRFHKVKLRRGPSEYLEG